MRAHMAAIEGKLQKGAEEYELCARKEEQLKVRRLKLKIVHQNQQRREASLAQLEAPKTDSGPSFVYTAIT